MIYVMVGLACSPIGCEWWKPAYKDGKTFETEKACMERVAEIKLRTVMFFDLKCEPVAAGAGS